MDQEQQQSASACAACGVTHGQLLRCGACKWVAYCSRTCQAQHWTASHRRMCPILQQTACLRVLERDWWRSRPPAELHAFEHETGLQAQSMVRSSWAVFRLVVLMRACVFSKSFYGEVLFLLLGLKCCVLFSNLPVAWRDSFARDVLIKSGLLKQPGSTCVPGFYRIRDRAQTPAEYDLSGDLVLANKAHEDFAFAVQALGLQPIEASASPSSSDGLVVSEAALARALDYPVALDQCRGNMIEVRKEPMGVCLSLQPLSPLCALQVGYFHVHGSDATTPAGTRSTLLTSYCASADDTTQAARIQMHFRRYQAHVHDTATIRLHLSQTHI